jgi:hypothetical protein
VPGGEADQPRLGEQPVDGREVAQRRHVLMIGAAGSRPARGRSAR